MAWYKVADQLDLTKPLLRKVTVNSKAICLVVHNGQVYALSAYCPHAGAGLSGGWCRDGQIICPYHRYSYDLTSGKGAPGQNDYVTIYPVKQEADGVYIEVISLWGKLSNMLKGSE